MLTFATSFDISRQYTRQRARRGRERAAAFRIRRLFSTAKRLLHGRNRRRPAPARSLSCLRAISAADAFPTSRARPAHARFRQLSAIATRRRHGCDGFRHAARYAVRMRKGTDHDEQRHCCHIRALSVIFSRMIASTGAISRRRTQPYMSIEYGDADISGMPKCHAFNASSLMMRILRKSSYARFQQVYAGNAIAIAPMISSTRQP